MTKYEPGIKIILSIYNINRSVDSLKSKKKPLYVAVQDSIKDDILEGALKPYQKLPQEQEFIEKFKVSRITIINALSQLADEGILERIPGRGSFVSESAYEICQNSRFPYQARSPQKKKIISLLLPGVHGIFSLNIINGILSVLEPTEYDLIITTTFPHMHEEKLITELLDFGSSGFIVFPLDKETYNEKILEMKVNKFPFVLIDRIFQGIETNHVLSDNYSGAYKAGDYLCGLGHKNIGLINFTPLPTSSAIDRINGFKDAVDSHRCKLTLVLENMPTDYESLISTPEFQRIADDPEITAIFCTNFYVAIFLHRYLVSRGVKVPEDKSIICFDYPLLPYFSRFGFISQ